MKPVKLAVLCSILAVAGCGDNSPSDTAGTEPGSSAQQNQQAADGAAGSITNAPATGGTAPGTAAPNSDTTADAVAPPPTDGMAQTIPNGGATGAAPDPAATAGSAPVTDPATGAIAVEPAAGGQAGAAPTDAALGQSVYEGKCKACHGTGAAGAPKLDDKANWAPRIAQGVDTLNKHALEGFKGTVGFMPPKGGFATLSDDEVKAAVAYMVSQAQ